MEQQKRNLTNKTKKKRTIFDDAQALGVKLVGLLEIVVGALEMVVGALVGVTAFGQLCLGLVEVARHKRHVAVFPFFQELVALVFGLLELALGLVTLLLGLVTLALGLVALALCLG